MSRPEWLSLIALVLAVGAIVIAAVASRRAGGAFWRPVPSSGPVTGDGQAGPTPETSGDLVAFVVNPTKPGVSELRDAAVRACGSRNLPEPLWFETTATDPGVGQARAAIEAGATVVVAVGGDGTVRAVAEALTGTKVSMGLIPQGTGNLLARNLDLPLTDPAEALRIALTGTGRTIDVGWLRIVRAESTASGAVPAAAHDDGGSGGSGGDGGRGVGGSAPDDDVDSGLDAAPTGAGAPQREHIFLVIAGLGFDAAMVADTDEELKARVGWIAYFVAGARHLHGRRLRLRMRVDDAPATSLRVRSLLIGNCGRLPGGITLLPDAELDDGWLDVAAIDTRGGIAGWAQLFGEVVLQGVGVRTELRGKIGRIDHLRVRLLHLTADRPEAVQVDGDVLGRALEITARVDPGALIVRVA